MDENAAKARIKYLKSEIKRQKELLENAQRYIRKLEAENHKIREAALCLNCPMPECDSGRDGCKWREAQKGV